jgi:5-methylcytosine-specific restriction protein A
MKLAEHPFCEMAKLCVQRYGRVMPATVVDHVVAVIDDEDLAYDFDNLRPCCKACHDSRTASEQGFAKRNNGDEVETI